MILTNCHCPQKQFGPNMVKVYQATRNSLRQ